MRHTQSTRLFKVHAAQNRTLVLGVSLRENDADVNRTRRTAVRRAIFVRDRKFQIIFVTRRAEQGLYPPRVLRGHASRPHR